MFKELDPLLHSQLRLAVMSILLSVDEADFVYLKEKTQATAGNLSVQIDKLSEAGYIEVEKSFVGKKPRTTCRITPVGKQAFDRQTAPVDRANAHLPGEQNPICQPLNQSPTKCFIQNRPDKPIADTSKPLPSGNARPHSDEGGPYLPYENNGYGSRRQDKAR